MGPRVLYLSCAERSIDSPLAKALAKPDPGAIVTSRNWKTATKLVQLTR